MKTIYKILLAVFYFLTFTQLWAQISVDTSFESANAKVLSINNSTNTIKIESNLRPGDVHNVVFYLKISGFNPSLPLKIQVKYSQQYYLPVLAAFSYDKVNWTRFTGTIVGDSKEFTRYYTQSNVYFCYGYPYVYSDMINLSNFVSQSKYAQVSNIAQSFGGRNVKLFRITEPCVTDAGKYSIWVLGRNHAMETHSNYVVEGLVKYLISDDSNADRLRRQAIVYVVPVMDVDNAYVGGTGKDRTPVDFNRDWDSPSYWSAVIAVKNKIIETNQQHPLKIFIDSHDPFPGSPSTSERLFFYSIYPSGVKSNNLNFYRKLLFENGNYPFDRQELYLTNGQTSTRWVDSMISTVEFSTSLETGWVNRTDGMQWTIPLYLYNGEVLGRGMSDHIGNIIRAGDIILDNTDTLNGVTTTGQWISSTSVPGYWGSNYIHDNNTGKGAKSVRYSPDIPIEGTYEIFLRWTQDSGRANNVPLQIKHKYGIKDTLINEKTRGSEWVSMGYYELNAGDSNYVLIANNNTTQYVIADAVRFSLVNNCNPIAIKNINTNVPEVFKLYQNYPNPFNPETKIRFVIPPAPLQRGVKIEVYNSLGQEIQTLVNRHLEPGEYEVIFDAAGYPSGMYFYSLIFNGEILDTKKMVLIK